MSPEGTVNVGVIGCGVGVLHLQGLAQDPRVNIVAIAGLDEARCQDLAKTYNVPRVYREYQELLADPDVEAVTVAQVDPGAWSDPLVQGQLGCAQ